MNLVQIASVHIASIIHYAYLQLVGWLIANDVEQATNPQSVSTLKMKYKSLDTFFKSHTVLGGVLSRHCQRYNDGGKKNPCP